MRVTTVRLKDFENILGSHTLASVRSLQGDFMWLLITSDKDPEGWLLIGDIMQHQTLYLIGLLCDQENPHVGNFWKKLSDNTKKLEKCTPEEKQNINLRVLGGGRCDRDGNVADISPTRNDWYTKSFDRQTPDELHLLIRSKLRQNVPQFFFEEQVVEEATKKRAAE